MTALEQTFNDVCNYYGYTVYDPLAADPELVESKTLRHLHGFGNDLIEEYRHQVCPKLPKVHFGFVDNSRLNAFAFHEEKSGCGFIAVHTGTICLIYDLFYRLLSRPDVLPNLGNSRAERLRRPYCSEGIVNDFSKLSVLGNHLGGRLAEVFPIDEVRKTHAESLSLIAFEFAIIHELAHLAAGHSEYKNAKAKSPLLFELQTGRLNLHPLVKQYFEVVADAHASLWSWLKRLRNMSDSQKTARALIERGKDLVNRDQLLMSDWVFAIVFMFWLFDVPITMRSIHKASHPPAPLRGIWANAHVYGKVQQKSAEDIKVQWDNARVASAKLIDNSLDLIGGQKIIRKRKNYYSAAGYKKMMGHLVAIMDAGNRVQPDVEKFNHYHDVRVSVSSPPALPPQTPPAAAP